MGALSVSVPTKDAYLAWCGGGSALNQVRMQEPCHGGRARQANLKLQEDTDFMATTTFPTRDDFAALLNKSLG